MIQQIDLVSDYVPYERPPQNVTLWSAIPRGLQSFIAANVQLDLKPINDDFILELKATLPPGFGYVFSACQFHISQNLASAWDNSCNLNLQNFYRASQNLSGALNGNYLSGFQTADLTDTTKTMTRSGGSNTDGKSSDWPTFPLVSQGNGVLINFSAQNGDNAAAAAGTVNFYISFWQFDLEQIRKYPINSPFPVHMR